MWSTQFAEYSLEKSESNWIEVMDLKIFLEELNVLFGKSANEIIDNEIAVYVKKWIWNDE